MLFEPVSKKDRALTQLARQYHELCEEYDRTVCSGPIVNGSIRPANDNERKLVTKNAAEIWTRLGCEAFALGFTTQEWQRAIIRG